MTALFALRWLFLVLLLGAAAWLSWQALKHDAS